MERLGKLVLRYHDDGDDGDGDDDDDDDDGDGDSDGDGHHEGDPYPLPILLAWYHCDQLLKCNDQDYDVNHDDDDDHNNYDDHGSVSLQILKTLWAMFLWVGFPNDI